MPLNRRGWGLRHKEKGPLRQERRAHRSSIVTRDKAECADSKFLF